MSILARRERSGDPFLTRHRGSRCFGPSSLLPNYAVLFAFSARASPRIGYKRRKMLCSQKGFLLASFSAICFCFSDVCSIVVVHPFREGFQHFKHSLRHFLSWHRVSLAGSCWVGVVSNDGAAFCSVAAMRGTKVVSAAGDGLLTLLVIWNFGLAATIHSTPTHRTIVPKTMPVENLPPTSRACKPSPLWWNGRSHSRFGIPM